MKLSNREKILLYIMACLIVACAGIVLVVLPSLTKMQESKEILSEKIAEKNTMEQAINSTQKAQTEKDEFEKSFQEKINKYTPKLTDEQIDRRITEAIRKGGFSPANLQIGAWVPFNGDITKIDEEQAATQATAEAVAETPTDTATKAPDAAEKPSEAGQKTDEKNADVVIYGADISVEAFGTLDHLAELIKLFNDDNSIIIRNYSFESGGADATPVLTLELKLLCKAE